MAVTGRKETDKLYYWHTGYVGGIKQATFKEMIARRPEAVIEIAVKGMLPKGPLGRAMFRKLKVRMQVLNTNTLHNNHKY